MAMIKGTCRLCGRTRDGGKPILKLQYIKNIDMYKLECRLCRSMILAPKREQVERQINGA